MKVITVLDPHRDEWLAKAREALGNEQPFLAGLTVEQGLNAAYSQLNAVYELDRDLAIFDRGLAFLRKIRTDKEARV